MQQVTDNSSLETEIDTAWSLAFQANTPNGPNPYFIPSILTQGANTQLNDVNDISDSSGQVNICAIPDDPSSPYPNGNALVNCTGMTISGFGNATSHNAVFVNNDTVVDLPIMVSPLIVNGSFTVYQQCCTPWFTGCHDSQVENQSGTFTMKINVAMITLTCSISNSGIVLNSVNPSFGSCSVSVSDGPSWLNWFDALNVLFEQDLAALLESQVTTLLSGSQLMTQMQNALNGLLGTSNSVAAGITREKLLDLGIPAGLPANARPYGPVAISNANGAQQFVQKFAATEKLGVRKGWQLQVTYLPTDKTAPSQVKVTSLN